MMNEQIFAIIVFGLILNTLMLIYGAWVELDWANFFKENYLLPLFLAVSGIYAGLANGETLGASLLISFILALFISVMFGLRFHSEHTLYKTNPSLNLRSIFNLASKSRP